MTKKSSHKKQCFDIDKCMDVGIFLEVGPCSHLQMCHYRLMIEWIKKSGHGLAGKV